MPQRRGKSKKTRGVKRLLTLVGAPDEIAPVDDAAFGKKAGELIARTASAPKRAKGHGLKSGDTSTPRKRER
jgi:hypothetical protein